jgi:hypothetical protein
MKEIDIDTRRYDLSQPFDVLVGPERKRFTVHHGMMTHHSGFFRAARSSRWNQDPRAPTDLTDVDPWEFADYLQLVYARTCIEPRGKLRYYINDKELYPKERLSVICRLSSGHYKALFRLHMLADRLDDLESANLVMDAIVLFGDKHTRVLGSALTTFVYDSTPPNSPLRKIVRDTIVYESAGREFFDVGDPAELPHELLLDVAKEHHHIKFEQAGPHGTFSSVYNKRLSDFPKCRYHQHSEDHPECK